MYSRLINKPLELKQSFFLFGPRGTGKTTWLRSKIKNGLFIDLLDSEQYTKLLASPNRLELLIPPGFTDWIIIDEIQKVPMLLNEVHRLIENHGFKFILTGSSARNLRKKGINLLAGRALTFYLYPLTALELGNDFNLEFSLQFGHLPAIFSNKEPEYFLKSYISTYLREEVLQEGLTRNLGDFSRFLEITSFSQGQVLNNSEVAREAGLTRKKVESYFNILEDLLLAYKLPVFTKWAKRRLIQHNKFYYFDVGVFQAIRPKGPLDSYEEASGAGLESLVYQELLAINEYSNLQYEIYYWRTSNGLEVDFILYGPKGLKAIEVKRTAHLKLGDFNSLKAFKNDYPETELFIFYGGSQEEYKNEIRIMPLTKAIKNLPDLLNT